MHPASSPAGSCIQRASANWVMLAATLALQRVQPCCQASTRLAMSCIAMTQSMKLKQAVDANKPSTQKSPPADEQYKTGQRDMRAASRLLQAARNSLNIR
jgi:hypothetical protein